MEIGVLLAAVGGCFAGIATGLVPGLHVNTISLVALTIPGLNNQFFIVFIACMSVVHTFVDFIPSILFGAPDSDTFLGVLPGHRMLLQGKGLTAVKLTVAGGLFTGIAALAISPFFVAIANNGYEIISTAIPFVLIAILASMILAEKSRKIIWTATIVTASGLLGLIALNSALPLKEPLFCLATGFFGASTLIDSIIKKPAIAEQVSEKISIKKSRVFKGSLLALAGGSLVSILPGIGASQAAFIARKAIGKIKQEEYLILLGGVNTATMIFSFFVLFALGKARTGSAVAISQVSSFGATELGLVASACLLALGFGAIATNLVASKALKLMQLINYRKANLAILCFVTALVFFFSGLLGIAFYSVAALTGLAAANLGIKRSNSMAFLMVPTIIRYLPFW